MPPDPQELLGTCPREINPYYLEKRAAEATGKKGDPEPAPVAKVCGAPLASPKARAANAIQGKDA